MMRARVGIDLSKSWADQVEEEEEAATPKARWKHFRTWKSKDDAPSVPGRRHSDTTFEPPSLEPPERLCSRRARARSNRRTRSSNWKRCGS